MDLDEEAANEVIEKLFIERCRDRNPEPKDRSHIQEAELGAEYVKNVDRNY